MRKASGYMRALSRSGPKSAARPKFVARYLIEKREKQKEPNKSSSPTYRASVVSSVRPSQASSNTMMRLINILVGVCIAAALDLPAAAREPPPAAVLLGLQLCLHNTKHEWARPEDDATEASDDLVGREQTKAQPACVSETRVFEKLIVVALKEGQADDAMLVIQSPIERG